MHLVGTYPTNRALTACLDNTAKRALSSSGYLATQRYEALFGSAEAPSTAGTSAAKGAWWIQPPAQLPGKSRAVHACVCSSSERNQGHGTSDRYHSAVIVFARDFEMSPVS